MATVSKIENPKFESPSKKRVAAYARVSMDSENLLNSLSNQISYFNDFIQGNSGWEFVGIYSDEAITGTSTKHREGFKRLIADCETNKIDLVLVKSISRFARDTVDCIKTVRRLKSIGVEVYFERERISTFTSDGELMLTLLASFAQAESESIGNNVRWDIRKKFEKGIPNGHKAPYGYAWTGESFRIIPEQGEIVQRIFREYLAGDSGYAIAKRLKEEGILGQYGKPMAESTIKDIVTNISYTGSMLLQKNYISEGHVRKHNKGELPRYLVEEMYEPLISVEDFEKAVAIRQARAADLPKAEITPFHGLVRCGNCGSAMCRRTEKSGQKKYTCSTKERKGKAVCDMKNITEKQLYTALFDTFGAGKKHDIARITVYKDTVEFRLKNGKVRKWRRE